MVCNFPGGRLEPVPGSSLEISRPAPGFPVLVPCTKTHNNLDFLSLKYLLKYKRNGND
jgi:hypothetical protein